MSYKAASEPVLRIELSINERRALKSAAAQLRTEFADIFSAETVERFVYSSYNKFATHATVRDYLALLAERFARQRLHAAAKLNGTSTDDKTVVLFLCDHNAGRSQMAIGFFTHLADSAAVAWSGGSEPHGKLNPAAIAVMAERGINITDEYPKPWTDEILQAAEVIITMSCDKAPSAWPGRRHQDWIIDDPDGKGVAEVRRIRDKIEGHVRQLIDELHIPSRA
jgi:arsenate reductase (thioredoxin)